tara:strand:+ start:172 stop:552 length:381 start_codon:yes stop_codon:yes gene_type:complete
MLEIPVSYGELIDKLSILKIKKQEIKETDKLKDIKKEFDLLYILYIYSADAETEKLYEEIYKVNYKLWKIEDDIRDKERNKEFDEKFIELARSVYITNDERMNIKHTINKYMDSNIKEHKSYKPYI